jgi:hypothetical protein
MHGSVYRRLAGDGEGAGATFTCFTSIKVQILTHLRGTGEGQARGDALPGDTRSLRPHTLLA